MESAEKNNSFDPKISRQFFFIDFKTLAPLSSPFYGIVHETLQDASGGLHSPYVPVPLTAHGNPFNQPEYISLSL